MEMNKSVFENEFEHFHKVIFFFPMFQQQQNRNVSPNFNGDSWNIFKKLNFLRLPFFWSLSSQSSLESCFQKSAFAVTPGIMIM